MPHHGLKNRGLRRAKALSCQLGGCGLPDEYVASGIPLPILATVFHQGVDGWRAEIAAIATIPIVHTLLALFIENLYIVRMYSTRLHYKK